MKNIKHLFAAAVLLATLSLHAQRDSLKKENGLTWYTDIMQANEASKAANKPLFAFFTGSDWCGWCRKLQGNVFAKPEFIAWAKKNVVLLELDFPRGKAQSPELAQQNSSLQQTFQVRGYPTIWLFFLNKNADGNGYTIESLGSLGYPQGAVPGKEEIKFLADANALVTKKNVK